MAYLTLQAIATDKGDSESSYEIGFSPRFEDLEPKAVAASAAARAIRKLGARGMDSAFLPAVFENRAAASLLGVLAPAFLPTTCNATSPLWQGEKVRWSTATS